MKKCFLFISLFWFLMPFVSFSLDFFLSFFPSSICVVCFSKMLSSWLLRQSTSCLMLQFMHLINNVIFELFFFLLSILECMPLKNVPEYVYNNDVHKIWWWNNEMIRCYDLLDWDLVINLPIGHNHRSHDNDGYFFIESENQHNFYFRIKRHSSCHAASCDFRS